MRQIFLFSLMVTVCTSLVFTADMPASTDTPAPMMAAPTASPIPYTLHQAAIWGNLEKVKTRLAMGDPVNGMDFQFTTPLHRAVSSGKLEIVKYLLANGADPEILDSSLRTPVMWAAMLGQPEVLEYLISLGVRTNLLDHVGWDIYDLAKNPLPCKSSTRQKKVMKILEAHGITAQTRPAKAETPDSAPATPDSETPPPVSS